MRAHFINGTAKFINKIMTVEITLYGEGVQIFSYPQNPLPCW